MVLQMQLRNPKLVKVRGGGLRDGHTKSCGCLVAETTKQVHKGKVVPKHTVDKIAAANRGPRLQSMSDLGKKYPYRGKYERGSLVVRRINQILAGARKRGLEISISRENIAEMITSPCIYCGKESVFEGRKTSSGIDRADNTKGYIKGNCVPCCMFCNSCKNSRTIDDFENHIINMYKILMTKREQT